MNSLTRIRYYSRNSWRAEEGDRRKRTTESEETESQSYCSWRHCGWGWGRGLSNESGETECLNCDFLPRPWKDYKGFVVLVSLFVLFGYLMVFKTRGDCRQHSLSSLVGLEILAENSGTGSRKCMGQPIINRSPCLSLPHTHLLVTIKLRALLFDFIRSFVAVRHDRKAQPVGCVVHYNPRYKGSEGNFLAVGEITWFGRTLQLDRIA